MRANTVGVERALLRLDRPFAQKPAGIEALRFLEVLPHETLSSGRHEELVALLDLGAGIHEGRRRLAYEPRKGRVAATRLQLHGRRQGQLSHPFSPERLGRAGGLCFCTPLRDQPWTSIERGQRKAERRRHRIQPRKVPRDGQQRYVSLGQQLVAHAAPKRREQAFIRIEVAGYANRPRLRRFR